MRQTDDGFRAIVVIALLSEWPNNDTREVQWPCCAFERSLYYHYLML